MPAGPSTPNPAPASGALPPAGGALPFGDKPLRTFALVIALPAFLIYVTMAALVIGGLFAMAGEIDRNDDERTTEIVHAALDSFLAALSDAVADEGTWDEAYLSAVVAPDPAWLDGTWGSTARAGQSYDNVLVTDSQGLIVFGENNQGGLTGNIGALFPAASAMLNELDGAIAQSGDGATRSYFTADAIGITGLAAISIHRATAGEMTVSSATRRILWIARHLTPAVLADFSETFRVPALTAVAEPASEDSFAPIGDATGRLLGSIVWRAERPGSAALGHTLLIATTILIAIGLAMALGLAALRRALLRRADSSHAVLAAARNDPETGHLSRFGLLESLSEVLGRTPLPKDLSVAHMGVDNYHEVHQSHGPEIAEDLMRLIGQIIAREAGKDALLGRVAPDSFVIGTAGPTSVETIKRLADTIGDETGAPVTVGEVDIEPQLSIGIATGPGMAGLASLKSAEAAMREARASGDGSTVTYVMADEGARKERIETTSRLRTAIKENQFELEYQPIFDLRAETLIGVEALLRWRRSDGELEPPGFIATAEAAGLMSEIGLLALRRAAREIRPLKGLMLGFNVGASQFTHPAFVEQLSATLNAANFPKQRLQLEIEQTVLTGQPHRAEGIIDELRAEGIVLALDDFVVGQSSIQYLRQFKLDRIKLARSLVAGLDTDPTKFALMQTTINFARDGGLAITALGVERKEEAAQLLRLGCTEFQGFLFARPMSLDALTRLIMAPAKGELKQAG